MKKLLSYLAAFLVCISTYGNSLEKLSRFLNSDIKSIEEQINKLNDTVKSLPPYSISSLGTRRGIHSFYYQEQTEALKILLDLGKEYKIDTIALFPASSTFQGNYIQGYGLPEEFTIEASNTRSFDKFTELYKHSAKDKTNSLYPIVLKDINLETRYLRINISKHWLRSDGKILSALSELMVFSGNRNIALHKKVEAETNILPPKWEARYLVDGQTDWGAPISNKPSKTNGYVSKRHGTPYSYNWILLDLGKEYELVDIRLIPAQPFDAPANPAHGFPRHFKLETSKTKDFKNAHTVADVKFAHYPGGNAVTFNLNDKARYIKLSSTLLKAVKGESRYALALSEIQAYTLDKNVALNCNVETSGGANFVNYKDVWGKQYLVDGFSSQNELIELKDWLFAIDQKRITQNKTLELKQDLEKEIQSTRNGIVYSVSFLAVLLALFLGLSRYQRSRKLKLEVEKLRTQIARDLHDDLGSRLGGIRLLSQVVLDDPGLNDASKVDLQFINNSAISAVESMREIVWLTDGKDIEAKELIEHMHTVSQETLNKLDLTWNESCCSPLIIPFYFRRHLAFAFRECLGNIIKHANASKVIIEVLANSKEFSFKVSDDGCGFDHEKVIAGNGLSNFRQRAKNINGDFKINSTPGEGTTILFKANL